MTEKQEAFCREYLIDYNATQAAIRAGYSEQGANTTASKLLANTNIKKRLSELKKDKDLDYENRLASPMEIKAFLAAAMRGEIKEECIVTEGIGEGQSEARIISKYLCAKDRIKAADILARAEALFVDRVKIDNTVPVVIKGEDAIRD